MTAVDIKYIIKNRRRKLYWWDYLGYALFAAFIGVGIFVSSYPFLHDTRRVNASNNLHVTMLLTCVITGLLAIRGFRQNIHFVCITTPLSRAENKALIIRLLKKDKCDYHYHASGYLYWDAYASFFNGKEEMEAIPLDNEILVNSHPDDKRLFSIFADKANVRRFIDQVQTELHTTTPA